MSGRKEMRRSWWSLVSSIGLVLAVPWLLAVLVMLATDGFGMGLAELGVLWLIWAFGIVLVGRSWRQRW